MSDVHLTGTSDLSGMTFGLWKVVGGVRHQGKGLRRHWLCRCQCGKEAYVNAKNLVRGQTQSCMGCRNKDRLDPSALVGLRFGAWTAVAVVGVNKDQLFLVRCRCDCGLEKDVLATQLRKMRLPLCTRCLPTIRADTVRRLFWKRLLWAASVRRLEVAVGWDELLALLERQQHRCALTGLPIDFASSTKLRGATTASVDRIDASLGYVPGNVQWVHKDVNRMKWELPLRRFVEICRLVAAKHAQT